MGNQYYSHIVAGLHNEEYPWLYDCVTLSAPLNIPLVAGVYDPSMVGWLHGQSNMHLLISLIETLLP